MYKQYFKRLFDFVIALVGLLLIWPLLLFFIVCLACVNKGSGVFFIQSRPGKDEKPFGIIKFKTMSDERDSNGNLLPDYLRITRIGKFIRSTSIDELPQLINVLKGDMSLIGPRPLLGRYLPYYTCREKLRHTIRPGITGWAQVNGRNLISWDHKLEYDAYYAENISLMFDIKILCLTVLKVLKREGAIADKRENYLDIERSKLNR